MTAVRCFGPVVLGLLMSTGVAHAIETCPMPVRFAAPDVQGALDKAKDALGAMAGGDTVVVLDTGVVNYQSSALRKSVKALLPQAELSFVSGVDLDQQGRLSPDASLDPKAQPGAVDGDVVKKIGFAVDDIATVRAENMDPGDWEAYAGDLKALADQVWFVDREDLRPALFNLYYQIGRAADNAGVYGEPWVRSVDGMSVNAYYYLAASLADGDPDLMEAAVDDDQRVTVQAYVSYLETGRIDRVQIPLDLDDTWNADDFFGTYKLVVNGRTIDPDALGGKQRAALRRDGLLEVAPGLIDVQLQRKGGGQGLSRRVINWDPEDPAEPLRVASRAAVSEVMSKAFNDDPGGCVASAPSQVLPSLAVFGKLNSGTTYIAMAEGDDPSKPLLWKLDTERLTLNRVMEPGGGFPVRFAGLVGTGATFNGATYDPPAFSESGFSEPDVGIGVGMVPMYAQLRGHYRHLVVMIGGELGIAADGAFADRYQTGDGHTVQDSSGNEVLKEPTMNRLIYLQGGYMHGKEAADGFGIRATARVGWYDVPHTIDLSLHGGLTTPGPIATEGRVKSVIDVGGFLGMLVPFGDTLIDKPMLNVGITAGAGTTF